MNVLQLSIILLLGIIAIKTYWVATELHSFKDRANRQTLKTNVIEAVILIAQIAQAVFLPLPKTPFDRIIIVIGAMMYVIGFILALWARFAMSSSWGIPGIDSKKQKNLITTGPFSISRNPIYLGFLFIYFGFAIAIRSWLLILRIPLAIYFYRSAKKEEKILEKKFGKKFIDYKSRVRLIL